jgi:hypothetical protein
MARPLNLPEVGKIVDKTLGDMKERMIVIDSSSYSAAIKAWRNVAASKNCNDREEAVKRSLELLHEMTKAFYRTTSTEVRTTRDNYNNALEALTYSKNKKMASLAETLLTAMEKSDNADAPDADSYSYVIDICRKATIRDRVKQAESVLKRFESRLPKIAKHSTADSLVNVYNNFIDICSDASLEEDEVVRENTMKAVLKASESMRRQKLRANAGTYAAMIKACHNLIPFGKDQQRLAESLFRTCCDEGFVDQNVMYEFRACVSTSIFSEVVVNLSEEIEGGIKAVPQNWTRNAVGSSVQAKRGRTVLLLSIDGRFRSTVASKKLRMRKLSRRSNKRMLEGGRF